MSNGETSAGEAPLRSMFWIPRRLCCGTILESSHLGQVPAALYVSFNYLLADGHSCLSPVAFPTISSLFYACRSVIMRRWLSARNLFSGDVLLV
jgi:hypothetical protein